MTRQWRLLAAILAVVPLALSFQPSHLPLRVGIPDSFCGNQHHFAIACKRGLRQRVFLPTSILDLKIMGGMSDSGAAEESTGKPDAGYTEIRFMDYRRDELPVEKAVALTGQFTYAEAWKAVIIGAISVNGSTASAGQLVRRRDELKFEGSSPSIVPRIRDAMSGNNIGMLLSGKLLPERQEIVYYLL